MEVLEPKGSCTKHDLYGATIEVLHSTHPERVRLSGIDYLEKGQAFGTRAKQAASALVLGRDVTLQPTARTSTGGRWRMCSCSMART